MHPHLGSHTDVHACTFTHPYAHTQMRTHTSTHTCTHTHAHTHAYTHAYTWTCTILRLHEVQLVNNKYCHSYFLMCENGQKLINGGLQFESVTLFESKPVQNVPCSQASVPFSGLWQVSQCFRLWRKRDPQKSCVLDWGSPSFCLCMVEACTLTKISELISVLDNWVDLQCVQCGNTVWGRYVACHSWKIKSSVDFHF